MNIFVKDYSLFLLIIQIILYYLIIVRKYHITSPVSLISLALISYPVVGTFSLHVFQEELGWYRSVEASNVNFNVEIATILFLVVIYFSEKLFKKVNQEPILSDFNELNSFRFILFSTLILLPLNTVNFMSLGYFPVFWSVDGNLRFIVGNIFPIPKALAFTTIILCLNFIHLFTRQKYFIPNLILLVINFFIAASIGSRFLVLFPLLTALLYALMIRKFKARTLLVVVPVFLSFILLFKFLRGDISLVNILYVLSFLGEEYKDFILLVEYFTKYNYEYGKTLLPVITNMIPKEIFSLFGIDKEPLRVYSAYIFQEIWGTGTGIRTGIWGEGFLNFGYYGVYFGLPLFGIWVERLTAHIRVCFNDYAKMLFLSILLSSTFFLIIASAATVGDTVGWYLIVFFFYSKFVVSKKPSIAVTQLSHD